MDLDNIQPYDFEPEYTDEELARMDAAAATTGGEQDQDENQPDMDEDDQQRQLRVGNSLWCQCDNCQAMPTVKESLCCTEECAKLLEKLYEHPIDCIVDHPEFGQICLTDIVLELLMHALREVRGYGQAQQWENRTYRLVAYRAYTFWVHHRLGKNNRRVIPSCVVWAIRNRYPSPDGTYVGYKDVEAAWEL